MRRRAEAVEGLTRFARRGMLHTSETLPGGLNAVNPPASNTAPTVGRLLALDAFRGLTVAGMILVNNPGIGSKSYAPLRHAEWDGFTPTDLVFPSFLFIVGVAIPLALGKRVDRGDSRKALLGKIFWRSAVIFGLGLILNAVPFDRPWSTLRIPGVLQRIALCYFAASLIFLTTRLRGQILATIGLLLGYWALMTLHLPGFPDFDLSKIGNFAAWIDRMVLADHLYKPEYDPEGILSTLPALATTLIGVLTGHWLLTDRPLGDRVAGIFVAGAVAMLLGSAWNVVFPITKALWTGSFVLWTAGLSLQLFGACLWLIEIEGRRRWAWPFLVFGSNAIAAYVLSGLGGWVLRLIQVPVSGGASLPFKTFVIERILLPTLGNPALISLAWALLYVLFWLLVMAVFYRLKWFIRV